MAERGPGADNECLSQGDGCPSIFLSALGDGWGHPKASGDIPKLLGYIPKLLCPGAHGNHSTLPEPTSGGAGLCPHGG